MNWLIIGLGGSLGAISRYLIGEHLKSYSKALPLATLFVNAVGSFIFGLILKISLDSDWQPFYLFLTGGFLGSFTTFSTFSFESITIVRQKKIITAFAYIGLHILVVMIMITLGFFYVS
ncbi:hypothetical protein BHF71_09680 [Vulcanibacillus modesticaldus]|uniref:Fluoride-specific ion channel FluC n=1 Tax=Vulcanibacillus modesticaldus TaxID=337097 RepID=A0A1D2YU42_9BACI|nr:fluoride efflux transporter CrcB [Vulcanibacillus modesticaldus]OEF99209.1 hypothetical protein BHF71_09680 [Vulcanibacillus modesticaldus]